MTQVASTDTRSLGKQIAKGSAVLVVLVRWAVMVPASWQGVLAASCCSAADKVAAGGGGAAEVLVLVMDANPAVVAERVRLRSRGNQQGTKRVGE